MMSYPVETPFRASASPDLTPAERRVAALMARGLENAEIAAELSVSLYTVKKQVSQVLFKLRARNRTHAVVLLIHPDAEAA